MNINWTENNAGITVQIQASLMHVDSLLNCIISKSIAVAVNIYHLQAYNFKPLSNLKLQTAVVAYLRWTI